MIRKIFKFCIMLLVFIAMSIFYSIKYIFTGGSKLFRILDCVGYGILIWTAIYAKSVALVLIVLFILLESVVVIYAMKNDKTTDEEGNNTYSHVGKASSFFAGMDADMAKKTYRKLLKQYHPDNAEGDLETTQKIIEDYKNYCAGK